MGPRICILLLALAGFAAAQVSPAIAARQWRELHERSILDEFVELLRIPNVGQQPESLRRNAESIARMFERRGVGTRLLETEGSPPYVYGEILNPNATQTVVFYAHYDGQPVNPGAWHTGDPFKPVLMSGPIETGGQPIPLPRPGWPTDSEWRIYARSAGDDKSAIIALAAALDALRGRDIEIPSNVKFFFDGEEESGSPHLIPILEEHRELLAGDIWFFCDGPLHQSRQQQLVFGARGVVGLELTVYGPRKELHSGHYGNWAPNPGLTLARLLASMKDDDGKVLVEGFYDDVIPLSEAEEKAIYETPDYGVSLKRELWLPSTEGGNRRLEEAISQPSLNIRGILTGAVGEDARNVIPASASASLDIRLVAGMDHNATVNLVLRHIEKQGFFLTESEPGGDTRLDHPRVCKYVRGDGYNASRTPIDSDLSRRVIAAVERARGPVIKLPSMGGSLPLFAFEEILGAKAIIVPIANHDDNQHTHNENIRLQNLWDGIETMAALMTIGDGRAEGTGPEPRETADSAPSSQH